MDNQNNQNHLRNAGRSVAKGAKKTANAVAEGRFGDAAQTAWNGTVTAAREVGLSAADMVDRATDGVQNVTDGPAAGQPRRNVQLDGKRDSD